MFLNLTISGEWRQLVEMLGVNIFLSGDNAIVIALAAKDLPKSKQKAVIFFGFLGAIVLRVFMIFYVAELMMFGYLQFIGSILLCWIGVKFFNFSENQKSINASADPLKAIKIIMMADVAMSYDNVIAVAGATHGRFSLLILSLVISIPLMVFGASILMHLMKSFPIIVTFGAGLLGWIAGEMAANDVAIQSWMPHHHCILEKIFPWIGLLLVIVIGNFRSWRKNRLTQLSKLPI